MEFFFEEILKAEQSRQKAAFCIIIATKGSSPRKVGAKMIVYEDRKISGTIGGGHIEKQVIEEAIAVLKSQKAAVFKHDLVRDHKMCCGGRVEVYIEPIAKKQKLFIFGAGHTGQALARHSCHLGFEVWVFDDRQDFLDQIDLSWGRTLNFQLGGRLPDLPFDDQTYIVIMTYDHAYDRNILAQCLKKSFAYVGLIGSRRKEVVTERIFRESGIVTEDEYALVDIPIGIGIKAETPDEIAISIAAKLIEVKNTVGKDDQ